MGVEVYTVAGAPLSETPTPPRSLDVPDTPVDLDQPAVAAVLDDAAMGVSETVSGEHHGGNRIVGALRLDEEAAQAEQPRILALGHGAEGALRAVAVTVELRRLGVQQ